MKMTEIRKKAKQAGVKVSGKKTDVILRIQEAECYEPCFGTRDRCDQMDCCWREDCLPKEALELCGEGSKTKRENAEPA